MRIFWWKTKGNLRRAARSGARRIALPLLLALCGVALLWSGRGAVGTAASAVFSPIAAARVGLSESAGVLPSYFSARAALSREIASLTEELRRESGNALKIKRLEAELQAMRETLGFRDETWMPALVLMHPGQLPYDTLLIDKGSADGVVEGAVVYAENDIVLGSVLRAYAESALVLLASAPGVRTNAYVFGPDIFVAAEGRGGGVLRLSVPQGVPLAEGAVVILPGAGKGAYGEIVSVESAPEEPAQYGYVTTPLPLRSLRFVRVAKKSSPALSYEEAMEVVNAAQKELFRVDVPEAPPAPPLGGAGGASTTAP